MSRLKTIRYLLLLVLEFSLAWASTGDVRAAMLFSFLFFGGCWYLIEFGDEIGARKGYWTRGGYISEPTPGVMIKGFGWVALILSIVAFGIGAMKRLSSLENPTHEQDRSILSKPS